MDAALYGNNKNRQWAVSGPSLPSRTEPCKRNCAYEYISKEGKRCCEKTLTYDFSKSLQSLHKIRAGLVIQAITLEDFPDFRTSV